jgi:hypothetical protein
MLHELCGGLTSHMPELLPKLSVRSDSPFIARCVRACVMQLSSTSAGRKQAPDCLRSGLMVRCSKVVQSKAVAGLLQKRFECYRRHVARHAVRTHF